MQRLRRLSRRRSSRTEEGVLLVDGPVLVAEAVRAGMTVTTVFAERDAEAAVVEAARAAGARVVQVHDGVLAKALDLVTPQSLVGVALQPRHRLDEVLQAVAARRRPVLVLVSLQDPGNAGTLARVAEGAGCAGIALSSGSVDVWNPKTVRASAGALFRLPVVQAVVAEEVLDATHRLGLPTVASVASGGAAPETVDLGGGIALFLGSEAHGLPAGVVEGCEARVTIPTEGGLESLNAAMAGAVLAFEGARQRRSTPRGADGTGGGPER